MSNNNFNRQSPKDFMRGPPLGPGNMPPNKMMIAMNGPLIHPSDDPFGGLYASRALSEVEKRYSQVEREALAIVWGCERLRLYLLGKEFET
jgi:hypothetical protein